MYIFFVIIHDKLFYKKYVKKCTAELKGITLILVEKLSFLKDFRFS
jgi:hypothetical protein